MKNIFPFLISFLFLFRISSYPYDSFPEYSNNLMKKYEQVNKLNFWIKRGKNLDKIIMNKREINILNKKIEDLPESTIDIFKKLDAISVKNKILAPFNYIFFKDKYFYENGMKINNKDKKIFLKNMNLKMIGEILKRNIFAVTVKHSFIKSLPTNKIITKFNLVKYFDRNRETVLHLNEIVRILNVSNDKKYYFISSKYSFGWVKTNSVAIINNINRIKQFNKKFVIITKNYKNFKLGDILPLKYNTIYIPTVKRNFLKYIPAGNIPEDYYHKGYLIMTKRNILKLVFNIVKSDYKWGGAEKNWDCSLFIMDILRCFGINFPRNSKKQSEIPVNISLEQIKDKESFIINKAEPLVSLIYTSGHIMLYMGAVNNKAYIAHDFTFLNYHRGKLLITDFNFGREGFDKKLKKLVIFKN